MTLRRKMAAGSLTLVTLLLLASTSTLAVGTVPIDQSSIQTSSAAGDIAQNTSATAQLETSIVTVRQGEETTLQVTLDTVGRNCMRIFVTPGWRNSSRTYVRQYENTTNATIVVGGEESDYNITITITDTNEDGTVPLEFRTGSIGMEVTRFHPTNDGDDYGTLNAAPNPDRRIPVGEYPIAVYVGHGVGAEPTDIGTLSVTAATQPPNASIEYSGATLTLHPRSKQTITGTTELNAGRTITIGLRSSGQSPFIKTQETTVNEGGEFTATFDLSDIDPPSNATATVHVDGEPIAGPVPVDIVTQSSQTSTQPQTTTQSSQPTTGPPHTTTQSTQTPAQVPGFGAPIALVAISLLAIGRYYRG